MMKYTRYTMAFCMFTMLHGMWDKARTQGQTLVCRTGHGILKNDSLEKNHIMRSMSLKLVFQTPLMIFMSSHSRRMTACHAMMPQEHVHRTCRRTLVFDVVATGVSNLA